MPNQRLSRSAVGEIWPLAVREERAIRKGIGTNYE